MVGLSEKMKHALSEKLAESVVEPIPAGTPRKVFGAASFPGRTTAVIGMRRAGKTTFLHRVRGERLAALIPQRHFPYLNFEDERLAGLTAENSGFVVDELGRITPPSGNSRLVWCFDEIPSGSRMGTLCETASRQRPSL